MLLVQRLCGCVAAALVQQGQSQAEHLGCCGKNLFVIALLSMLESCERRLALAKHLLLKRMANTFCSCCTI